MVEKCQVFLEGIIATEFLKYYYKVYSTEYLNFSAEELTESWYWINYNIKDWKDGVIENPNEDDNEEKADFMIKMLKHIDQKATFYQATGNLAMHAGFVEDGNVLDSGVFTVNNQEYIFVIVGSTQDEVLAIAKNIYDKVAS
jgi:hypothetical protein